MAWTPLSAAVSYGVLGPIIGVGITALILAPAVANLGPLREGATADFIFGAYVIGAPPMIACGFLAGVASQRGRRLPSLTGLSAYLGLVFVGLSALFWAFLGPGAVEPTAAITPVGLTREIILWIATVGAFAGFGAALLTALIMAIRRPMTRS